MHEEKLLHAHLTNRPHYAILKSRNKVSCLIGVTKLSKIVLIGVTKPSKIVLIGVTKPSKIVLIAK